MTPQDPDLFRRALPMSLLVHLAVIVPGAFLSEVLPPTPTVAPPFYEVALVPGDGEGGGVSESGASAGLASGDPGAPVPEGGDAAPSQSTPPGQESTPPPVEQLGPPSATAPISPIAPSREIPIGSPRRAPSTGGSGTETGSGTNGAGGGGTGGGSGGDGSGEGGGSNAYLPPRLLAGALPIDPEDSEAMHVPAEIPVRLRVGVDGRVKDVVPEITGLSPAVMAAVERSAATMRFTPARRGPTPIEAWFPMTFVYRR